MLANRFNPDVTIANSFVRKLETRVKDQFKEARDRGAERLDVPIEELFEYLEETTNLDGDDTEKETRKTPRLLEKGQVMRATLKNHLYATKYSKQSHMAVSWVYYGQMGRHKSLILVVIIVSTGVTMMIATSS